MIHVTYLSVEIKFSCCNGEGWESTTGFSGHNIFFTWASS